MNRNPKPGDFIIAACILILAVGCFFLFAPKEAGQVALVLQNGEIVHKIDLYAPQRTVMLGPVTLSVGGGQAAFTHSDCPDQVCVRSGSLTRAGQSAACLPNRIAIVIEGKSEVDMIAG